LIHLRSRYGGSCPTSKATGLPLSALYLAVFHDCRQVQPGDFHLATVIEKHNDARSCRMHRSMIRRGNDVFVTVTRPNCERLKGSSVQ